MHDTGKEVRLDGSALVFSRTIHATPAAAFRAWTGAGALREWLCDGATVEAAKGGRYILWWNGGYAMAGAVLALEAERSLAIQWDSPSDPGPTLVEVDLSPAQDGVLVTVRHRGLREGEAWNNFRARIKHGWETGLENLQSTLETGEDLRFLRRPLLGVALGDFTAEIAARLGIASVSGVRLDGVDPGNGADEAGLRRDDVITAIGNEPVTGYASLTDALQRHRAGDVIEVLYYRDGAQHATSVRLSERLLPPVPATPADLAERLRNEYETAWGKFAQWLAGSTPGAARARPAPGEWSALETVAHMIASERELHIAIVDAINDDELRGDRTTNATNVDAQIGALAATYDTPAAMLAALRAAFDESVDLLERLPPSLLDRRAAWVSLARATLEIADHADDHVGQVRETLHVAQANRVSEPRAPRRKSSAHAFGLHRGL